MLLLAIFWNAPLEEIANPVHPPNPAKAPWYFLGLQELVSYSAFWGGVVVPALLVTALAAAALPGPQTRRAWASGSPASARWPSRFSPSAWSTPLSLTVIGTLFRGPNWAGSGAVETARRRRRSH